ncbi:platelet-derived growth factor receptor beta-like [Cololabis saira]|uniref:platelet-derived growth factor receptor beta-like n=1 Tax=Cololabis saira TaxID=129043 RepID=UPI002AD3753B|nr:platelet-derived growth factor receptor beta-like [Cololabis saira]
MGDGQLEHCCCRIRSFMATMAIIPGRTESSNLLHFLLGVFLLYTEGGISLELLPSTSKVLLQSNSSYTVLCSGWSQVMWQLPQDLQLDGVFVDNQGSSSTLQLVNATWRNSGRYTCEETQEDQSRHVDVFIPGQGPDEWFVPLGPGVVMKEAEEDTIPCVVSDPKLSVSLYERPDRTAVAGMTYEPARGFTGRLNDTSYVCVAEQGAQERESQVYYVYSIIVPKVMDVDLSASSSVLKQGEVLTINCTAKDMDMVYFSWDFPRRKEIEPVMDFLPNQIRSFVNITEATMADSGVYICMVQETSQGRRVKKNITVTVLERGYVYAMPLGDTNLSTLLHYTVEFSVEVDAHPAPTVQWMRNNQTIAPETTSNKTIHMTGSRYMSTLTLVGVQMNQTGTYMATASNEDDADEVIFHLEVQVPPKITSLSEVGSNSILCVSEGVPPPSVTWYTCHGLDRCTDLSGNWTNLSAASEGVALQDNITEGMEGGVTKVRSVLTLKSLSSVSAVRCKAQNSAGGRIRELRVLSTSLLSQVAVLAAVLALVVIALIFLIILIVLWRKKPRCEGRWKVIESVSPDGQGYIYMDPADLPYNLSWEIPRDHIVLGQVLGSGAFGRVVEATVSGLTHTHSTTKAAVKMVKARSDTVQSLMSELKVMVHLGPHLNVVNLLGACTTGGPLYLITEFCRHGDLVSYLQRNKQSFLQGDAPTRSDGDGGYMDMNKDNGGQYVAMKELSDTPIEATVYEVPHTLPDQQEATPLLLSNSPVLILNDLISFSFQICEAMDFLSSRMCVNRDLAARNVLVSEGKLVKICDFGLARDLNKNQDYITRGHSFLPLKWMSPESIFQNIYSSQSGVWSYGVLLWEIFSLGSSPYPDLPMNREFYSALKTGYRMDRPEHAPTDIHDLMQQCWEEEPQSRPSFSSLGVSVGNMLTDDYKQRYLQIKEDFLKGENPAVVRFRRTSSRSDEAEMNIQGSPTPEVTVHLLEVEPVEAGSSHGSCIIPVTDITVESGGDAALDAVSPQILECQGQPGAHEVISSEEAPASSCSREEEEESCL